jgi:RNA polymerase-binding transcription factor DksA
MENHTDELDIASAIEEMSRAAAINRILSKVPVPRDIESLIIEDLECDHCGCIIPVARQRIVLSIAESCNLCVDCQQTHDKREKLYHEVL